MKKTRKISKRELSYEIKRKARLREGAGVALASDVHSYAFWKKKYGEFLRYIKKKGLENPFRGGRDEFISNYLAVQEDLKADPTVKKVRPMNVLKYGAEFSTEFKTALAELKFSRDLRRTMETRLEEISFQEESEDLSEDEISEKTLLEKALKEKGPTLKELKTMTTREFAEKNAKYLRDYYHKLRNDGMSSRQARDYISNELFGSP